MRPAVESEMKRVAAGMEKAGSWSNGDRVANGRQRGEITGFALDDKGFVVVANVKRNDGSTDQWDLYDIEKDEDHGFPETEADQGTGASRRDEAGAES
jgi:hypothetical protein